MWRQSTHTERDQRMWTSTVQLKTPCRPSLLTSDCSWTSSPLTPFWRTLVVNSLFQSALPAHRGDRLGDVPPLTPWTPLPHTHTPLCNSYVRRFGFEGARPQHIVCLGLSVHVLKVWVSAQLVQIIYEWNTRLTAGSCLFVTIFSMVTVCWYCAAVEFTLKVKVLPMWLHRMIFLLHVWHGTVLWNHCFMCRVFSHNVQCEGYKPTCKTYIMKQSILICDDSVSEWNGLGHYQVFYGEIKFYTHSLNQITAFFRWFTDL